jgi:hypothetical protein
VVHAVQHRHSTAPAGSEPSAPSSRCRLLSLSSSVGSMALLPSIRAVASLNSTLTPRKHTRVTVAVDAAVGAGQRRIHWSLRRCVAARGCSVSQPTLSCRRLPVGRAIWFPAEQAGWWCCMLDPDHTLRLRNPASRTVTDTFQIVGFRARILRDSICDCECPTL